MNCRRLRPAIMDRDEHEDVLRIRLGVFDEDIEVAVVVEDAGVEQLELRLVFAATTVLLYKPAVGKFTLRILIEHFQVGMCWRGVEVIVQLLGVFSMVALVVRQAKDAFLQNRVFSVPQSERKTKALLVIADPGDAVLAPAIRAAAGVVVGHVFPGVAVWTVVLAHGAPLAFGQVRPPKFPALLPRGVLLEAKLLGCCGSIIFHWFALLKFMPAPTRKTACERSRADAALLFQLERPGPIATLRPPTTPGTDSRAGRAAARRRRSQKCDRDPPPPDAPKMARGTCRALRVWLRSYCREHAPTPRRTDQSATARRCPGDRRRRARARLRCNGVCSRVHPVPASANPWGPKAALRPRRQRTTLVRPAATKTASHPLQGSDWGGRLHRQRPVGGCSPRHHRDTRRLHSKSARGTRPTRARTLKSISR